MNIFEPLNKILIFYFKGEFCFRFHLNLILKWLKLLSWQLNYFFFILLGPQILCLYFGSFLLCPHSPKISYVLAFDSPLHSLSQRETELLFY